MKMPKSKAGKSYEIISTNPKMDTSGMAGKPKQYEVYAYAPPAMDIEDMMEVREMKTNKKPEAES